MAAAHFLFRTLERETSAGASIEDQSFLAHARYHDRAC